MNKTALITGGNSGIGFATAQKLKEMGYHVHIAGRDPGKTKQAAFMLGTEALVADIERLSDIQSLITPFEETGLDVLINNAGIAKAIPIGQYDEQAFNQHFYINVRGPLFLIQSLLPALEKRKGSITTVSSIITQRGALGFAIYAATKGAIEAFTRNLAVELAPRNIRINAVCPGAIDTPMFSKMGIPLDQLETVLERVLSTIPLKRFGNAKEVADVIAAQVESTYVTGSIWVVDGGVNT